MFTGIIEAVGVLKSMTPDDKGARISVNTAALDLAEVKIGDSVAVNGVCLTVVAKGQQEFQADLSAETLARTTFRDRRAGDEVNLERALTLAKPLGGHLVSGHVDGIASVKSSVADGQSRVLTFQVPEPLHRYVAEKGSICVDGVSLTVNSVEGDRFAVCLIPHTLDMTTLKGLVAGSTVNIEVDLMARYAERLIATGAARGA